MGFAFVGKVASAETDRIAWIAGVHWTVAGDIQQKVANARLAVDREVLRIEISGPETRQP
jgi:hypothetical protein